MRVVPLVGAVQVYQTERPPTRPAWLGSPGSLVAFWGCALLPLVVMVRPVRVQALAKASLAGWASRVFGAKAAPRSRRRMPDVVKCEGKRIAEPDSSINGSGSRGRVYQG